VPRSRPLTLPGSFVPIDPDVEALIERLGLKPLPVEATLFAQTYRSDATGPGGGPAGSAGIGLYCDDPPSRSSFHRLAFDELWHFYAGDPLRLVLLDPDGSDEEVVLGDPRAGGAVQHLVPAGVWQAGELVAGGRFALFGCTMAPGFTGACFEGGRVDDLLASHPARASDIERLGIPAGEPALMPDGFAA
jgi:predicted cupin superfamily sugar epimerase